MKRFAIRCIFLSLLALAALPPGTSSAQQQAFDEPPVMISADELSQIEQMTGEKRLDYLKKKRTEFQKLSEEKRKQKLSERKTVFESLPEVEQKELKERMQKLRHEIQAEHFDKLAGSPEARAEKIKALITSMTPEQRKQWDALEGEREKWERPGMDSRKPVSE